MTGKRGEKGEKGDEMTGLKGKEKSEDAANGQMARWPRRKEGGEKEIYRGDKWVK